MDRINLAEDRDKWRPLLNTVTIVKLPREGRGRLFVTSVTICFSRTDPK